jgi:hypothetical protein
VGLFNDEFFTTASRNISSKKIKKFEKFLHQVRVAYKLSVDVLNGSRLNEYTSVENGIIV